MPDQGADLTLLRKCGDNAEAAIVRGMLEANGIECVVQGEQHRSMLGVVGGYIELNVLVSRLDFEKANALLGAEALKPEPSAEGGPPDLEGAVCAVHEAAAKTTCSRCGSFLCAQCEPFGDPALCESCDERIPDTRRPRRRRAIAVTIVAYLFLPLMVGAILLLVATLRSH